MSADAMSNHATWLTDSYFQFVDSYFQFVDSYFQFVATSAESDQVTTDTQFLSCSLAGRRC